MKLKHLIRLAIAMLGLGLAGALGAAPATPGTPPPAAPGDASSISLHATIRPDPDKTTKAPCFSTMQVQQYTRLTPDGMETLLTVSAHILQGEPEVLSLVEALDGEAPVVELASLADGKALLSSNLHVAPVKPGVALPAGIESWGLRKGVAAANAGRRYLDFRIAESARRNRDFSFTCILRSPLPVDGGRIVVPVYLPAGSSSGVDGSIRVVSEGGWTLTPDTAAGLDLVDGSDERQLRFRANSGVQPVLVVRAGSSTVPSSSVALEEFSLKGKVVEDYSVAFGLKAVAIVREAGAALPLLAGDVALESVPAGARVELRRATPKDDPVVWLVFDAPGRHAFDLAFSARVASRGQSRCLSFSVPAARVAPYSLTGLPAELRFDAGIRAPVRTGDAYNGFLPPGGTLDLAWTERREEVRGRLFFTSDETSVVRVGDGIATQSTQLRFGILQGEAEKIVCALAGEGEIMAVRGDDIRTWQVVPGKDGARLLEIELARPRNETFTLTVDTRTGLGAFPASFEAMRVTPVGAVRHGGFVRIDSKGAVRLAVAPHGALTQVVPTHFPGVVAAGGANPFVYRISAPDAGFGIRAEDVLPEVAVTQVLTYSLGEDAMVIDADLDIEISEAPLRELVIGVADGCLLSSVNAADLADSRLGVLQPDGTRALHLLFSKPVAGRLRVNLRLEKPGAPAAEQPIAPMTFGGARTVRGFVGVCAAPGMRLTPAGTSGLVEIASAFFPNRSDALQQTFRIREAAWKLAVKVERLAQAVQTDVLHQYQVGEGSVLAGTVVNYVIVGSPLSTLRFNVPAEARNLEFTGGDIRGWKRDGDSVEVSLHRPVMGAFTLLATFELPLAPQGGALNLAGVRPQDVQSEQGYILVTSTRAYATKPSGLSPNLLAIEPGEIPAEYRLLADAPLLAAYQYTGGTVALSLDLRPRATGDAVTQVVEFEELETRLAADGQIATELRCLVKARGQGSLRVHLPAGAKVWTVTVDGNPALTASEGESVLLVPIPAKADPNAVTDLRLRLAGPTGGAESVKLVAPALDAPVLQASWIVRADKGRCLLAMGGDMALANGGGAQPTANMPAQQVQAAGQIHSVTTAMLVRDIVLSILVPVAVAAGIVSGFVGRLLRRRGKPAMGLLLHGCGLASLGVALLLSLFSAWVLLSPERSNPEVLSFTTTFLAPGATPAIHLAQVKAGEMAWSPLWTLAPLALAAFCGFRVFVTHGHPASAWWRAGVWGCLATSSLGLSSVGCGLALVAALFIVVELVGGAWVSWKRAAAVPGAALLCLLAASAFVASPKLDAAVNGAPAAKGAPASVPAAIIDRTGIAESIRQKLVLSGDQWVSTGEARVSGRIGDRFELLRGPAALSSLSLPEGVRLERATDEATGQAVFRLVLDKAGTFSVPFAYTLPVSAEAGECALPTGRAIADAALLDAGSPARTASARGALAQRPDEGGLMVVFPTQGQRSIVWGSRTRDPRTETLVFYAETANLYTLAPGIVEGRHRVTVRPSRGMVRDLELRIPEGFTVSGVSGTYVGDWRFDPEKRALRVNILSRSVPGGAGTVPSSSLPFEFVVDTQRATGALPAQVAIESPQVIGAAGSSGLLALASGSEVAIGKLVPTGLSGVNGDDFPAGLVPAPRGDEPAPQVRKAWRHAGAESTLVAELLPVEPELRLDSDYTLSLGEDRTVFAANLRLSIIRAGIFELKFVLPGEFDVENISGPALSHWTESKSDGRRVVTLHLASRTLGDQRFAVTLAGPGLKGPRRWTAPRLEVLGIARETGRLLIVPEEGLRLHPVDRAGATQSDPGRAVRKGTLAFGLHQKDWKLDFQLENAAPWIRCDWLQDVTVGDGRVGCSTRFEYTIENSALRAVTVRLPSNAEGVRFVGDLIADSKQSGKEPGLWEVRLNRRVIGKLAFEVLYRLPGTASGNSATLDGCAPVDASVRNGWVAVRTSGRLNVRPAGGNLPVTLRTAEWQGVPATLRRGALASTLLYQAIDPVYSLPIEVAAHDLAKLLPVRVKSCSIDTLVGPSGSTLNRVELTLDLAEKRSVRFTLPAGGKFWHAFANDIVVVPAVEGDSMIVAVEPHPKTGMDTKLELWYSAQGTSRLKAVRFDLPLADITWNVRLPAGMELASWDGDFEEVVDEYGAGRGPVFTRGYLGSYSGRMDTAKVMSANQGKSASELIQLSKEFQSKGNQQGARQALMNAANLTLGNDALNEDVRVQYNNMRVQQIEYSLNARRNKALADNGLIGQQELVQNVDENFTEEQAVAQSSKNDADANIAIRRTAERFVALQMQGVQAPEGIRTLMPDGGRHVRFHKALQTGSNAEMALGLDIEPEACSRWCMLIPVLLGALLAGLVLPRFLRKA